MIKVDNSQILTFSHPLGISFNEETGDYTYWFKQKEGDDYEWKEIGDADDLASFLETFHLLEA